jgi:predicted DNA-binding transcriptional regulator YafY
MTIAVELDGMSFHAGHLRRLRRLDRMLRSEGIRGIEQTGQLLGCDRRTVSRDLNLLRERFHADIVRDRGRPPRYRYRDPEFSIAPFDISEADIAILLLGEAALRQYRGTPFERAASHTYRKLVRGVLGYDADDEMSGLEQSIVFDPGQITTRYDTRTFRTVLQAANTRQRLKVRYHTAHRLADTHRLVDPYMVFNRNGEWYVAAFDLKNGQVQTFHLARIAEPQRTGQGFAWQPGFDIHAYLQEGFGLVKGGPKKTVRLEFLAEAAVYVRDKQWSKGQKIVVHDDKSLTITFRTDGLEAIKRWVLQFGGKAKVLAPNELRDMVRHDALALAACHGERPDCPQ